MPHKMDARLIRVLSKNQTKTKKWFSAKIKLKRVLSKVKQKNGIEEKTNKNKKMFLAKIKQKQRNV